MRGAVDDRHRDLIGTQVGQLKLVGVLGSGGMGTVYLAEHVVLKDRRAIKFLAPQFTQHQAIVARFVDEARATAALRHRNLVRVYDIGQLPDSGAWFTVMEYLEGGTLSRFMTSQGGPIAPYLIIHVLAPVLACMQVVHGQGIVHRDLKPDNIFLVREENNPHFVKVLDLGVAQLSEDFASGPRTKTGTVIGTPLYMAPEALRGQRVSRAADIFAVGVIAYRMATGGYFPWQREESLSAYFELAPAELCHRQLSIPPIDPRFRVSRIAAPFAEAIIALLHRDPAKRPDDRTAAMLLAEAAATDGVNPDGIAVLREVAPELMQQDNLLETARSHRAIFEAQPPATGLRFQLGEKIGSGGMAEVFLGTQFGAEGFERRVAIKRVLPEYSDDVIFSSLFTAEAKLLCQLVHPNIVAVLDFSRDVDGRLFLVMEYVHGRDLAALLETGAILPSTIIYIIIEILRGLSYVHDLPDPRGSGRGLVHRDITPHNVLLSYEGEVKVADFGLARMRDASGQVRSDVVRGTPSYMSPEQCNGEPLDGRSDLRGVGVILWELLAGRPMLSGSLQEIVAQVRSRALVPPSAVRGGVPPDLEAIAMKLLAHDREARYPTAQAALDDLLECAAAPRDGRGQLARLLAERFPGTATRVRDSGRAILGETVPGHVAAGRAAAQITAVAPASTLGIAASQSVSAPAPRARWSVFVLLGVFIILALVSARVFVAEDDPSVKVASVQDAGDPIGDTMVVAGTIDAELDVIDGSIARAPAIDAGAVIDPPGVIDAITVSVTIDASSTTVVAMSDAGVRPNGGGQVSRPPVAVAPQAPGELIVLVKPWATITLDGKALGETPYRGSLSAGRHVLRLVNEDLGKNEWVTVTVVPGRPTTVERRWR